MSLTDIFCPPIPESWNKTPRVIVEEGKELSPGQIRKKEEARLYQQRRTERGRFMKRMNLDK